MQGAVRVRSSRGSPIMRRATAGPRFPLHGERLTIQAIILLYSSVQNIQQSIARHASAWQLEGRPCLDAHGSSRMTPERTIT
jgi:hypothetical protein